MVRVTASCSAAVLGLTAACIGAFALEDTPTQVHAQAMADAAAQGFAASSLRPREQAVTHPLNAITGEPADQTGAELRPTASLYAPAKGEARFEASRDTAVETAPSSARDMECLTQAVYFEARGETAAGQAAVAQVVLNRVRHPGFPKSVCGVVYQGARTGRVSCQFSFACDGSTEAVHDRTSWRRAQAIAARALGGFVMTDVGSATHFHAVRLGQQWGSMVQVAQVGLHVFYRINNRAEAQAAPRRQPKALYASLTPVAEAPRFQAPDQAEATPSAEPRAAAESKPVDQAAEPVAAKPASAAISS